MICCDHGYGRPSWRPRVWAPATYRSGTPRNQHPAVARWQAHLHGLATAIHETSGLTLSCRGSAKKFINPQKYVNSEYYSPTYLPSYFSSLPELAIRPKNTLPKDQKTTYRWFVAKQVWNFRDDILNQFRVFPPLIKGG